MQHSVPPLDQLQKGKGTVGDCPHPGLAPVRSGSSFRLGSGWACRVGAVGGSGELPLDTSRSGSVIWPGESGRPDAGNFDFDVSRIT